MVGEILLDSFRVVKRIAAGGFGIVDEGVNENQERFAIKRELASHKVSRPILEHEYHILKHLAGHRCIPDIKTYGRQGNFNILVMELLGHNLRDRFRDCANHFSLSTTARLGIGMLDAIEHIHSRGFIHRDIKPDNFILGLEEKSDIIHLIDYGLARRWKVLENATHVSPGSSQGDTGVIGTLAFASQHAHLGLEQTRRDDMHAFAYTILLFARGNLPWDHIRGGTRKHCARRILEKKRSWTPERLCENLSRELEEIVSHCLNLSLNENPNYALVRNGLISLANREGSSKFEWDESDWQVSEVPETEIGYTRELPGLNLKRGDIVLLKISPERTLDYEPVPRVVDSSFFPHQIAFDGKDETSFRPAVIRTIICEDNDPEYYKVQVYPLTLRNLDGLSRRRRGCFRPIQDLTDSELGMQRNFDNLQIYTTSLLPLFGVAYEQASDISPQLSLPEDVLTQLEADLACVPTPYSLIYDSDDEETRAVRKRLPKIWSSGTFVTEIRPCKASDLVGPNSRLFESVNGWIPDMLYVEELRYQENGGSRTFGEDSDSDSDEDADFWDWPRPADESNPSNLER
ncbi:Casein kinase 1-like protein 5 [Psilocybe cubensis]|uniref:Casein kinase 1-like protein 5 n=1 Tax=Psilocybe cubensis TaxID=181762 RepID=A0ACB8GN94_PSICU|nr:Casein kinase 1-like protein 5 [Psilocybe cubensis]KAH9476867.1 Casein kinase 1-like protein 5 [Psilocybe cubensis]